MAMTLRLTDSERLGWLATAVFLEINGVEISRASNDDVYDLVIDVAAGPPTVDTIAERLRQLATWSGTTAVPRNLTDEPAVGGSQGCIGC